MKNLCIKILVRFFWWLPDKIYLRFMYFFKMGRILSLNHPETFTEKLQWLKLYDRQSRYTTLVDKVACKDYVASMIGKERIIPTIAVWNSVDEIDIDALPHQFVLKTSFGGGGTSVIICRDKNSFDFEQAKQQLNRAWVQPDIYKTFREWPYKNVPRRILAERYMQDDSGELRDYKFYCFNGKPEFLLVASNRFSNHNFNFYDTSFKRMDMVSRDGDPSRTEIKCPATFNEMLELASKISTGIPFLRVDLYSVGESVYFGEATFFDSSGYDDFRSDEVNRHVGELIKLPVKN